MENIDLKPVKGIEDYARKQFGTHIIWYHRKGYYAQCMCAECGKIYVIRTKETGDPFEDDLARIEVPARDRATKCRQCGTKAIFKPTGHTKYEHHFDRICYGQKIDDEHFVFRIFYTTQSIRAGEETEYRCYEDERIYLEKGKKPTRYDHYAYYANGTWYQENAWHKRSTGENWWYKVHPRTYREIKKTGMFKYVPVEERIMDRYRDETGLMDYYIAAARYPDFEMIIKMGLTEYALRLVERLPCNLNPRGKKIEDRLRINKDRIKELIEAKGGIDTLTLFQLERRSGAHWSDEDIEIIKTLMHNTYGHEWKTALKYISPVRIRNYMKKQRIWPNEKDSWQKSHNKRECRNEYYDYISMRAASGYDMTDEVVLFPKDLKRRHDEMVLEIEKAKIDKRKKEVLERFPKIKTKYRRLSEKYSAAAGGYIIRPAKDAAEIVTEGRLLHHCVGGDNYLKKHNAGKSFILFLRPIKDKDIPYITVEIIDDTVVQWYGAYDKKPNKELIDAWLKTYTKELKKRKKTPKKSNCTGTTKGRQTA